MAQLFDPIPAGSETCILCCYVNATSKIQVVRITNIPNWYFERVVFPGQRLVFEALPMAQLEVHSGMMASAILTDTILCERLRIESELEAEFNLDSADAEPLDSPSTAPAPVAVTATAEARP
jgi:Domain of unknown function (DUF1830)